MTRPRLADVLGCGTIAFDTRVLRFDPRGWAPPNMDDLHVALLCARRGLRRVMIPRPQFWLKAVQLQQADSIFKQMLRDDRAQTRLALVRWPVQQTERPRRRPFGASYGR